MQESVKQDREKYIGGSDIPIIMGLSPFKSRYNLLLEKAGYRADDFEGNIYTEYGNKLEPKIRDYINKAYYKNPFIEGKHVREAEGDEPIGVRIHTDGENDFIILEIKTTSQIYTDVNDYKLYLVQLLYYMELTGKDLGLLAVYNRPDDLNEDFDKERLQLFNISREYYKDVIDEINRAIELFIDDLIKVKENPFITEAELLPAEIPDIAARIIALESTLDYLSKVKDEVTRHKESLLKAMDSAGVKSWTTPNGYKITRVADTADTIKAVTVFNSDKLKEEKPDIYNKYLEEKTEIKKGRSGYLKITAPKKDTNPVGDVKLFDD